MIFSELLRRLFKIPNVTSNVQNSGTISESDIRSAAVTSFATFSVIDIIASLCSKAEFKVYQNNQEFKGREWYSLNVKPNVNQSSTEFWREAVSNLLFCNELLIVPFGEQKIIADNFSIDEYALRENVFKNVRRGTFTFNKAFTASEVFYIKYSFENATPILRAIFDTYTTLYNEATQKYIASGGQKGTLEIPALASGVDDFESKYADLMNNRFKSFFKAKNAVLPLWNGMKYTPSSSTSTQKSSSEISDIKTLFDEAITRASQAYKFPPQLVRGEVSGIKDAIDYGLTTCIDPLLNCISEEFSGKEFTPDEYLNGNYIEADTTNIKHVDIFELAPNIDKLISCGFSSVDEAREKAGLKPTGEEWAQDHFMTKNYQTAENAAAGGGEQ